MAEKLAATTPAGVLLDLSGVMILLLAFACLGSKLFNRYVAYYGAQSVVLAFAAGVAAWTFHSAELWVLAAFTLLIKGITIPLTARGCCCAGCLWPVTPPSPPACPRR